MQTNIDTLFLTEYAAALELEQHDCALDILYAQQKQHPTSAPLRLLIAAQHMHLGDIDDAEAAYLQALVQQPDLHIGRFQLGLLQFTSGRPQVAFASWAALEELGESHYLVCFKRAFAALAIDAFPDAALLLQTGINRNSENGPLNNDMRMMLQEVERLMAQVQPVQIEESSGAMHQVLASYTQNL